MLHVRVVLLADVFHQFPGWLEPRLRLHSEWFLISAWIDDGDIPGQCVEISSSVSLDGVQLCGMRMAVEIKPEFVVITDRVYDDSISLPMANRVSVPGGIRIFRMRSPIHEDLPVAVNVSFKHDENMCLRLVRR